MNVHLSRASSSLLSCISLRHPERSRRISAKRCSFFLSSEAERAPSGVGKTSLRGDPSTPAASAQDDGGDVEKEHLFPPSGKRVLTGAQRRILSSCRQTGSPKSFGRTS